ncbi:MAG: hypothetical protein NTX25_20225 [Proteobacteria bacterium]|nr:hypothetical protein [Pseudomonadota bacterium]
MLAKVKTAAGVAGGVGVEGEAGLGVGAGAGLAPTPVLLGVAGPLLVSSAAASLTSAVC